MKLHLDVRAIKGVEASVSLDRPTVIHGAMGSGKTAMIEALMLALRLPTRYGLRNLDRLSPTGQWMSRVRAEIEGIDTTFEWDHGRSTMLMVNGGKVPQDKFDEAVLEVTNLRPHHVDLMAFVNSSGQKRAEIFGEHLAEGDSSLDKIIGAQLQHWLASLGDERAATELRAAWALVAGTGPVMLEKIRDGLNSARGTLRGRKEHLDNIQQQLRSAQVEGNAEEIQSRLSQLDEERGRLQSSIDSAQAQADQQKEAARLMEEAKRAVAEIQAKRQIIAQQREQLASEKANLKSLEASAGDLNAKLDEEKAKLSALPAAEDENPHNEALKDATLHLLSCQTLVRITDDFVKSVSVIPVPENVLSDIAIIAGNHLGTGAPSNPDQIAKMAIEIVGVIFKQGKGAMQARLEEAQAASDAAEETVNEWNRLQRDRMSAVKNAEHAVANCQREIDLAQQRIDAKRGDIRRMEAELAAPEGFESIEAAMNERERLADERRADMEAAVSRLGTMTDTAELKANIETIAEEAKQLRDTLRKLNEAHALAGQVERARLAIAIAEQIVEYWKEIEKRVSDWRNERARKRFDEMVSKFAWRFKALLGASPEFAMDGSGRSLTLEIYLQRGVHNVTLDLLSGGETVLASIAFLFALQELDDVALPLVAVDGEHLDDAGLKALIEHGPKVATVNGRPGLIIVTDNHARPVNDPRWRVITMEKGRVAS